MSSPALVRGITAHCTGARSGASGDPVPSKMPKNQGFPERAGRKIRENKRFYERTHLT
jgi:hypothetical protein